MMQVTIETREKVKSRKVNKYVRLYFTATALEAEFLKAKTELAVLMGTLTGGQIAEAQKMINSQYDKS